MAILTVLKMGNPILRQRSIEVTQNELQSESFQNLLKDMIDTMNAERGIGLAAPQIGVLKRVVIIDLKNVSERYPQYAEAYPNVPELQGLGIYINPKWEFLTQEKQSFWEGCLSVPGLRGRVERPRRLKVEFTDPHGNQKSIEVEGFLATVFQHEFDHLDGVLYVDRLASTLEFSYVEEYQQFWIPSDQESHPEELD
jgi:peptide deformylase